MKEERSSYIQEMKMEDGRVKVGGGGGGGGGGGDRGGDLSLLYCSCFFLFFVCFSPLDPKETGLERKKKGGRKARGNESESKWARRSKNKRWLE